jgi:hypothetical protein
MNFELCSYMSYIYMRKQHKVDGLDWGSSFRKGSVRGRIPKDSSVRGSIPNGELSFTLMSKRERLIRCTLRELDAWRESTKACFQWGAMVTWGE